MFKKKNLFIKTLFLLDSCPRKAVPWYRYLFFFYGYIFLLFVFNGSFNVRKLDGLFW